MILEFIQGISQFSVKGDKESKLRCKWHVFFSKSSRTNSLYDNLLLVAFKIYDMDKDGYISNGE